MNKRLLVGLASLLVLLAAVAVFFARPRGADPISEEDAVEAFREDGLVRNSDVGDRSDDGVPTVGVYSYDSEGREVVKLGPLPAEERPYGEVTTAQVTVVPGEPGCFTFTLNLLEQHTEDSTWCRTEAGGASFDSYAKHQSVAQFDPTVNISCDPAVIWEPGTESLPLSCGLSLDGGPMEVTSELVGTAVAGAPTSSDVGGATVEVVPVDVHFDLEGSVSGTWDERLWLELDTALPVRVERSFQLEGFAQFDEVSELHLRSLEPSR